MSNTKAEVLDLLKNYRKNQQRIALLRYELEHPVRVNPQEMIEALSFSHHDYEVATGGQVSDKTPYIALNYREMAENANSEVISEIAGQLCELERKQERLHFYLTLLDESEEEIIRLTYMKGMINSEIGEQLGISSRTVSSRRNRAIMHLAELFEFMASMQQ